MVGLNIRPIGPAANPAASAVLGGSGGLGGGGDGGGIGGSGSTGPGHGATPGGGPGGFWARAVGPHEDSSQAASPNSAIHFGNCMVVFAFPLIFAGLSTTSRP